MTKFIALGRTVDGRLFPLAVDSQGRLVIADSGTNTFVNLTVTNLATLQDVIINGTLTISDLELDNLTVNTLADIYAARLGSQTGGNYTNVESDGTLQAFGNATCWRDELQPLTALRITSPSNDFVLSDTEASVICKASARYPTDFIYTNIQLNHDWVLGTEIHPHLHWWQVSSATPNWLIGYRWQRQGQIKTTDWTLAKWQTNEFTYTAGTLNQITEFEVITPPVNYNQVSDILQIKFYRDYTNVSTKFTGNDPATGIDVQAVQFDIHMQVDMLGSHQEYIK